jgi:hypothetical protein
MIIFTLAVIQFYIEAEVRPCLCLSYILVVCTEYKLVRDYLLCSILKLEYLVLWQWFLFANFRCE